MVLLRISHQKLAQIFKLLTFDEQFKLKYGRSVGRPATVSAILITETCQAVTPTRETKETDSVKTTISSDSRSPFKEYTKCFTTARWTSLALAHCHIVGTDH